MARTRSISDEQILDAAREVFLEHGPAGTTAEIARRAGISEGTIFRRFPTKNHLFFKAMGLPSEPPFLDLLDEMQGQGQLRDNLERLFLRMMSFFDTIIPKIVMIKSLGISPRDVLTLHDEPAPIKGLRALTNFFDNERKLGRIRNMDPEIIARNIISSAHYYCFAEFIGLNHLVPMARESFVRGTVDQILRGIEPRDDEENAT